MNGKAHILIADDEEDLRETLRILLEGEGYTVSEAADGAQALNAIRTSSVPMVVLLDLLMPVMSGDAVLQAVAADPILAARDVYLLLTANNRPLLTSVSQVLTALNVRFVAKPFDIDALLAEVAQAAARLP
ncbi:MAG TPA: response regulator [Ktedonobacterales bacterium]